ncbi:uncharacterized protein BKA55DRAFT_532030 [Fusarium redolens]|uniref:Uncharacterized protein n=1 Tax=Fusarium redolens TaxID=48865 RepID=A0A9P9R863_FUSRE|nr:uncharacterized protein BKA55DRAFT_532030 [Fusarium redolens]KAH7269377.1 hypothetical protein BKA55DRAFT_532030 [Fusarium redolens]
MAHFISSFRSQMKSGNRMSDMSSDSKLSSTFDKESDTSSAYSDYSEFQDSSSTYAGNSTDSTTVQVNFDHWGERDDHALTSTLQRPPFSPRVVAEHQRRSKSPIMDLKARRSSADSIRAVWGSPERHSRRSSEFQSSHQSNDTAETRSSRRYVPTTLEDTRPRVTPVHRTRSVTEARRDATSTAGTRPTA